MWPKQCGMAKVRKAAGRIKTEENAAQAEWTKLDTVDVDAIAIGKPVGEIGNGFAGHRLVLCIKDRDVCSQIIDSDAPLSAARSKSC